MRYVGSYGSQWRQGVVTDHVRHALDDGYSVRVFKSGRTFLVPDAGGVPIPVLCGELVPIRTEDGILEGRCGDYVLHNDFACPGHARELRLFREQGTFAGAWGNEGVA